MPFLNQTRRDSVGSQTIAKYGLGGGAGGTQATTYVENPSSADRPPSYDDIQDWPGTGLNVVLDDGSTSKVTSALLSVASILPTTIAPGAVLATSTGFRGLPWQVHTAELELVQSPLSPFFQHSTSEWEIFRLDYTTFSEGAFSPSNASPSTQAYGVSIGTTGQTGRWWGHRLAVESSRLPSPSPDIHIFPQDINFAASDSGSLFVAVRVGSSVSLGSLGLYSWGYNGTAWRSRNHLFTSTSLGTCSTLALAPNIIAASNIINGAVTSAKMAVGAVLSTTIAAGAVLGTTIGNFAVAAINLGTSSVSTAKLQDASVTPAKTSFASDAWRDHNGALQVLQKDFTPGVVKSSDSWTLYRVNYTLASSTTFTPTNTASLESYGIALGGTGDVGRWWSSRLAVASTVLPTQSPDLYIFPQDTTFLNPSGAGSFFVAAKNGSAMQTALTGGTLTLRTWGYSLAWTIRTHSYTTSDLGEISAQTVQGATGGGLQYFAEDLQTVSGVPFSVLSVLATGSTTAGLALIPKSIDAPFVLSTTGDARGLGAIDLQRDRELNFEVASGENSGIFAGVRNEASGDRAAVLCGIRNKAEGADSTAIGVGAWARRRGEIAFSSWELDGFQGSSQGSFFAMSTESDVTLTVDNQFMSIAQIQIPESHAISVEFQVIVSVKTPSDTIVFYTYGVFGTHSDTTRSLAATTTMSGDGESATTPVFWRNDLGLSAEIFSRIDLGFTPPTGTTARATFIGKLTTHKMQD